MLLQFVSDWAGLTTNTLLYFRPARNCITCTP